MLEESRQATLTASSEAQRELSAVSNAGVLFVRASERAN